MGGWWELCNRIRGDRYRGMLCELSLPPTTYHLPLTVYHFTLYVSLYLLESMSEVPEIPRRDQEYQ